MSAVFAQHIDALISTGLGLWITVYSWRKRERLRASPMKLARALPILAPLVIVFGVLQFVFASHSSYAWQRVFTSDQRASAEFPCATTTDAVTDSSQGVSVRRVTVNCNVPGRDINLRLSYNEIPAEGDALTVEQRIEALKSYFVQQGFAIVSSVPDAHGDIPGYRLMLERDQGKARCLMRVAIAPKGIYRAIATSTSGHHDDPVIARFVDSFSLR